MFRPTLCRRTIRVVLGAGLAVVPAIAALAPSAAAAAASPQVCTYSGVLTPQTPIPVVGMQDGTYTFEASGTCAGPDGTTPLTISATGNYQGLQCATGTATGTANFNRQVATTVAFTLAFAGGQGTLALTSGGTGAGNIHLIPNLGGCVTAPATTFTVAGTLIGTF